MDNKVKYIINNWKWQQAKKIMAETHKLNYFFWETTLKCNLNCRHCGSDCNKNEQFKELVSEKVIEVFEDIAQNYDASKIMVAVTGGEPLIRKDLFIVLQKIHELGFSWGMVTNGMLVDEDVVVKCIETGMKTVSVSIDGMEESHNWLRNNDMSYKKAINALKLFVQSGKFQVVEAITCVNEKNIDELSDMYQTLLTLGVDKWRIMSVFPKGRAEGNKELVINAPLLRRLFDFINKARQEGKLDVTYSEEGYLGPEWELKVRDNLFFCGAGINVAGLLSDGSFCACPSLSREWIQGHVDELTFSEAWETRYQNMRNRKWMKSSECMNCKEWKKCQGQSLHLWDWTNCSHMICHYNLLKERE